MDDASAQDLYSLELVPVQVDETTRQQLVQKARNFFHQEQKLKKSEFFDHQHFFIISCKYLKRWKVFAGYDDNQGSQQPLGKFFGAGKLPVLNQDIVESNNKFDILFSGQLDRYNVVLKPGLQEGKDFIFGTQQMWEALTRGTEKTDYIQVKRKVIETADNKKVQIYYQKLTIIPINNRILKDIEYEKRLTLLSYNMQFSHYSTIENLELAIKSQIVDNKLPYNYKQDVEKGIPVKMWIAAENSQKQIIYNTFLQGCKANSTFSYRLYFDGEKMQQENKLNFYDIFDDSLLFLEIKEEKTDWCFFNRKNISVSQCNQCRTVSRLQFLCSCKFAVYCSKQCKIMDRTFHEGRCPNNAESDVEQKQLYQTEQSKKGIVGLRNLGNTCFMNSGLQCISHVTELTEYFLSNKYVQDINKDNPLGTKGQLCMAFANMLKHLWFGNQPSFSPTQLKRAIGKFQPMFSGYNQHDSGQLITYLLDGLHQDLNRVKNKPYVETKDYDGRPDHIIAVQQWQNFLKRNQSQIVDLMYGQYRSVVDCPICNQRSIQFDPFCMCSLPLINSSLKKMEITFLNKHLNMIKLQVCFDKTWGWTMMEAAQEIKKQINRPNAKITFYVGSYSSCQVVNIKRKLSEVRSQYKYRAVYARELEDGQTPGQGIKITLGNTIPHSHYKDQSFRKTCTPYRMYFFKQQTTLKQLHHRLYSYYKEMYTVKDYQAEVINVPETDKPIKLLAIATSRYNQCQYCGKRHCEGCLIPYEDMTLKEFVKNCQPDKIQFQILWRKNDKQIQKKFDQYGEGKGKDQTEQSNYKKGQTSIQDCLRLFSQPETLAEDNAYYCPTCKDLVLAKKQMQIYKAPKILALCLKRFKRKQYFSQKHTIFVDFPLENLDLSQFVINKNLPTHQLNIQQNQMQNQGPLLYDLFAVSNHFGSTGGGHYTAYCRNPYTGDWYDCDDSSVSKVSKKAVVSQSAYILFYKRKQT